MAYGPWPSASPLYKLWTNIGPGLLWAWNGNGLGLLQALIGPEAWTGLVVGMDCTCCGHGLGLLWAWTGPALGTLHNLG